MTSNWLTERAASLRRDRVAFVHATVVLAERPTSAKPGDEALVLTDGTIEGFVGGSCAEASVRAQSLLALESHSPTLLRISPLEEAPLPGRLTVVNPCLSGGTLEIFLEPVTPAPLLEIEGDTPIGRALAELARLMGFEVAPFAAGEEAAAVVVASHGRGEEPVLRSALEAGVPYVGLVASRRRGEAVRESLGLDPELAARLRTPAGLDIGARGPEEVALSILAEIISSRPRVAAERPEPAAAPPLAVDPVCGMQVASVEASLHWDQGAERWWFCGPGCLEAFRADPERYLRR
ncbi:MAG: XdhC family protein [Candidatus Dormiibacterota bacterium]